ncbi:MAG: leishmanolysin-related zinc metalloendopeptidase [Planktomarina sp.]
MEIFIILGLFGAIALADMFQSDDGPDLDSAPEKSAGDQATDTRAELSPPDGNDTPSTQETLDPFVERNNQAVSSYRSGDAGGYNIDIDFQGDWTADEQTAVRAAADYISEIIVDDVPNVSSRGEQLDDLAIVAKKENMDGAYGVLASARVTEVRAESFLPTRGEVAFDTNDIARMQRNGDWETTVLHEMFHTLGFGVTWASQDLLSNKGEAGLRFTGANATAAYNSEYSDVNKDDYRSIGVPVEEDGGAGTAGSHWDEDVFDEEFMTGILDRTDHISKLSIAALEDMGYDTLWNDVTKSGDATGQFGYS